MKADVTHAREIWSALQKFQDINAAVRKDGNNSHFSSKYATLENVINSIKEPCKKVNVGYQQWADGLEIHTRVFMINQPDDYIEQVLEMVLDANPQRMGSAITYYRRYSLGLIFNLQFDDDDGNAAAGITASAKQSQQRQPRQQVQASNPAQPPIKKLMGEFMFNQMLDELKKCTRSADMKKIATTYKNRYEMNENQIALANATFTKRFNYLKQCNK